MCFPKLPFPLWWQNCHVCSTWIPSLSSSSAFFSFSISDTSTDTIDTWTWNCSRLHTPRASRPPTRWFARWPRASGVVVDRSGCWLARERRTSGASQLLVAVRRPRPGDKSATAAEISEQRMPADSKDPDYWPASEPSNPSMQSRL